MTGHHALGLTTVALVTVVAAQAMWARTNRDRSRPFGVREYHETLPKAESQAEGAEPDFKVTFAQPRAPTKQ